MNQPAKPFARLNQDQQNQLLKIARTSLETYLASKSLPQLKPQDPRLNQPAGAFVSLRKKGRLRGCIGQFQSSQPLYQTVQKKTIDAAVNDPRFPPVKPKELKDIKIEISVLSPKTKIKDWRTIDLDQHGVVIKKGGRSGTFLPQVAKQTKWDKPTLLANLCLHKAGLPPTAYQDPTTELYTFTAQVFEEKDG